MASLKLTKSFKDEFKRLVRGDGNNKGIMSMLDEDAGEQAITDAYEELDEAWRAKCSDGTEEHDLLIEQSWDALRKEVQAQCNAIMDVNGILSTLCELCSDEAARLSDELGEFSDKFRDSDKGVAASEAIEDLREGFEEFLDPECDISTDFSKEFGEIFAGMNGDAEAVEREIRKLDGIDRSDAVDWISDVLQRAEQLEDLVNNWLK